ncbi:hypothetical protein IPS85_21980 [Xanthomonas perforans]|uniref:hypothetical protein n=1 Tax=Xanthomonas TaxID=338 RepID=UPI00030A4BF1|nr:MULTISPECIES: hypothetical protein [Xanthomonas]MBV6898267.1 hypothetical protein [Xanthomonas campestris pv. ionidii]MBZ2491673.1 hypothetical protein [Xanthomonas perforans]MBZ2530865.1 hypothetical protein [Xanthomonas perforans]MBZ2552412.1 hypothetical protein [Xanthomonas perforans]MBZ2565425.1 hypothetical protein [Xanthomonas perforans]
MIHDPCSPYAAQSVDDLAPTSEEIEAMAELGRQPGAAGYNDVGQLVQVQADGSRQVIEDQEKSA